MFPYCNRQCKCLNLTRVVVFIDYFMFIFQSSIIAVGYVFCQSLWARRNLFEFDRKNFEKLRIVVINSPSQASRLFENTFAVSPNYKRRILSILPLDQEASENKDTQSLNQVYGPLTAEEVSYKI